MRSGTPKETREWTRARDHLRRIRDRSRELGAEFSLVVFPVLFELTDDYPLASTIEEIERFAKGEEIPFHSLLPAFTGRKASDLWVSTFDQHPNATAHRIAARSIYDFITRPRIAERSSED